MAFWATTWEKTASTAAAEEQLARLQDGVVRLETKTGNEDTTNTLSHDVATLQTSSAATGDQLTRLQASSEAAGVQKVPSSPVTRNRLNKTFRQICLRLHQL